MFLVAPEVLDYVSLDSACDMWYVGYCCASYCILFSIYKIATDCKPLRMSKMVRSIFIQTKYLGGVLAEVS